MQNNICAICLEENIINNNNYKCLYCNNSFHNSCIKKMKNNICPLCRKELQIYSKNYKNCTFNNMSNHNNYNIDNYLDKWDNKKCFKNNHNFKLETLGDWEMINEEFSFIFKCMYIECVNCNKTKIIS